MRSHAFALVVFLVLRGGLLFAGEGGANPSQPRKAQVVLEVRLLSVSEPFFERIGIDFEGARADVTPEMVSEPSDSPVLKSLLGPVNGEGIAFLSERQLFMFMEASQGDRRTNILQAPRLTLEVGATGKVEIIETHHFVTAINVDRENGQVVIRPRNEAFQIGFRMEAQPIVLADSGSVQVSFRMIQSSLASGPVPLIPVQVPLQATSDPAPQISQMFIQQPRILTTRLEKTLTVPNTRTAVIPFGKHLTETRADYGPPVLSKIPYLSRCFRNVGYGRETQTVLALITARIVLND